MIRPIQSDPFLDDDKVLNALRQARAAAAARAAASQQPLIDWQDDRLLTTDAVTTELKDDKKRGAPDMGGMDD